MLSRPYFTLSPLQNLAGETANLVSNKAQSPALDLHFELDRRRGPDPVDALSR